MKIAIDISQICYPGTGVGNYTRELVKNLLKYDQSNSYILFGLSFRLKHVLEEYFAQVEDLNKNVIPKFFPIPQSAANLLWNKIHKVEIEKLVGECDIFHSSDWIQPVIKAKKITTIHDLIVYKFPETSHPKIVETQKRRLFWVKKECDKIITDSKSTKEDLAKILKIKPERVTVVYPGVDKKFAKLDENELKRVRDKFRLYSDYILTVGTVEPRKNIKRVISSFERLKNHSLIKSRGKPIELVIVGNFGWGQGVQQRENVRLLGYVKDKDLPPIYQMAKMFVYPSLYEGFGFPILEAMLAQTPVITSKEGSLAEIVGDNALIVDPLDEDDICVKMAKLFLNDGLRDSLIKNGKKHASDFQWKKTAQEVISIYQSLVK